MTVADTIEYYRVDIFKNDMLLYQYSVAVYENCCKVTKIFANNNMKTENISYLCNDKLKKISAHDRLFSATPVANLGSLCRCLPHFGTDCRRFLHYLFLRRSRRGCYYCCCRWKRLLADSVVLRVNVGLPLL